MEKIGQLIIPRLDIHDRKADLSYAEYLIRDFHIGSFIVFGGDVASIADTLNHLQSTSEDPILFSADLERGLGQQVKGVTDFPYFIASPRPQKAARLILPMMLPE